MATKRKQIVVNGKPVFEPSLERKLQAFVFMVPEGFRPEIGLDLTFSLGAHEFHYRHIDGRLHVLRFRLSDGEKIMDHTFSGWRWQPNRVSSLERIGEMLRHSQRATADAATIAEVVAESLGPDVFPI